MSRRSREEAVSSAIGVLFMILITVFLAALIGAVVLNAIYPEKPVYTAFDVKELNSTMLRIISVSGSSVPLDNTNVTINGISYPVTGADGSGDDMWNPGETLMLSGVNLSNYTTISIISGRNLLFTCDFPARSATPVPTPTPSPTPTPTPTPVASFYRNVGSGIAPLSVAFTDTSSNAIAWNWDFGDGNTSTLRNPSNVYNYTGSFTITLTVTGPDNVTTSSATGTVFVFALPTPNPTVVPTPTPEPSATPDPSATPTPTPTPTPSPGPYSHDIAEKFYGNTGWSGTPLKTVYVSDIRFANLAASTNPPYWETHVSGWPTSDIGMDSNFSIIYNGYILINDETDYTFILTADDGAYLTIDNNQIINDWTPGMEIPGLIHLTAGYHPITVGMIQYTDQAYVHLEYMSPLITRRYVTDLYH